MKIKHFKILENNKRKNMYLISYILFFLYSCLMLWEVFIGPYRSYSGLRRYNLYPFNTIKDFISNSTHYTSKVIFINLAANIITFIPLGFFISLLFKRFKRFSPMFLLSTAIIITIELCQFILNVGVLDIDDVILNTLGCILGFITYKGLKVLYVNLK